MAGKQWYAVRCVFEIDGVVERHTYEERITLWHTESPDQAIDLAEAEAVEYAGSQGDTYLGLAQSYQLESSPSHATEVFSLMRDSDLEPDDYLDRFFDAGDERQTAYGEPDD